MSDLLLRSYLFARRTVPFWWDPRRTRAEAGEGLVSAALAVLIFAFLAALMWAVFRDVFTGVASRTKGQVDLIGQ